MLSHVDLCQRIESGEIQIFYYFLRDAGGTLSFHPDGLKIDLSRPTEQQARFFKERLFSDRLSVTLGPIIRSHALRPQFGRPIFRSRRDCTDIRESGNSIILSPYETVSVATNERIVLGGKTFALVVPRLTLGDAGILLNVTYIDAYWDGTLQLVISNNTPHAQQLSLLEPIAQVLFFNLAHPADASFRSAFPGKSHHYGQNWKKIVNEDAEPFPRRKRPLVGVGRAQRTQLLLRDFWERHQAKVRLLISLLLAAAGIATVAELGGYLRDLPAMQTKLDHIWPYFDDTSSLKLTQLPNAVATLQEQVPTTGVETIIVQDGQTTASTMVRVERPLTGVPTIWVEPVVPEPGILCEGEIARFAEGKVDFRLSVRVAAPTMGQRSVRVKWLLIP